VVAVSLANQFIPDYGKIHTYRSPAGFGIRLDGASAYGGAVISVPHTAAQHSRQRCENVKRWPSTASVSVVRQAASAETAVQRRRLQGISPVKGARRD
jgi:pyruvate carboxylase